jgi:DnaK suppressor protein
MTGKTAKPAPAPAKTKSPPAKAGAKSGTTSAKAPAKPAVKTAAKTAPAPKAPAKTPAAPAPRTTPAAKPAARPAAASSPPPESAKSKMPSASTTKSPAPAAKPAVASPPPAAAKPRPAAPAPVAEAAKPAAETPAPLTQRAGRPSSRLASLTVPSMAQSVASTAAKSSYMQLAAAPMIVPPLPSAARKDPKLANNWKTKPVEQLTDAELLAMPDSEYMNEKQLAAFRLKLTMLKRDILNSAGETTEHLREDTVVVPDPADRATIEEEHALELRTRDRERKLLKKIEQSIARIDAGDYGYCDETGEPIGVGRLLARPTATLSLEAQQRRELKQKMFGD